MLNRNDLSRLVSLANQLTGSTSELEALLYMPTGEAQTGDLELLDVPTWSTLVLEEAAKVVFALVQLDHAMEGINRRENEQYRGGVVPASAELAERLYPGRTG